MTPVTPGGYNPFIEMAKDVAETLLNKDRENGANPLHDKGATPALAALQQAPTTSELLASQPTSLDRILGGGG